MALAAGIAPTVILISVLALSLGKRVEFVSMEEYWPEVRGDLTRVTWAHATNSKEDVRRALTDGGGERT